MLPLGGSATQWPGVDTVLGPEMRSTGEVMGIDTTFGTAYAKSQAAGVRVLPVKGRVFVSVANRDKRSMIFPVKRLADLGFEIWATEGTAEVLRRNGVRAKIVRKHGDGPGPDGEPTVVTRILATTSAAGKAEHVVMVVWDGMRPDFVTESNTPTLYQLARDGVFFQNHHAVYLSSTEVNATAMATGSYPNRNGILGNREYRPNIDPLKRIEVQSLEVVRKGDEVTGNHYLHLPTIAEILQRAGKRTAIAGTKPVVILFDRLESGRPCGDCIDLFNYKTVPASAIDRLGLPPFTPQESPNTRQDQATTQALIGPMWDKEVPPFSLLWLSEPDYAQHSTGPGSAIALKAVKGSDDNLARVLKELDARGVRDKTDIFVVSDHGFSTISRVVSVTDTLNKAGFHAAHEFQQPPNDGDVMVVGNGGSALLYVIGHDRQLVKKIVALLQQQDFTGVIFTRDPMNGTFTLDQVRINTPDAPDIAVSFRWTGRQE